MELNSRGLEWGWGLGWPWRGVELVTPFRVGIGWRGVRQILELERVEWRGVASDTGEELERNCANPKQFSERERGVTVRYANGLSTLFAIRGHLWKPGMTHLRGTSELAATFQCS